jgi:4-oxalocrotonate tautomerase
LYRVETNSVVCFQQVASISTHFGVSIRIAELVDVGDGGFGFSGDGHFHSISRGRLIAIRGGSNGARRGSTDEFCGAFHLARLCIQEGRKAGGLPFAVLRVKSTLPYKTSDRGKLLSGGKMPYIQITWVAGRNPDQKRRIAEQITETLIKEGNAKKENIQVTFVDLPPTDYAEAGVTVADQKRPK